MKKEIELLINVLDPSKPYECYDCKDHFSLNDMGCLLQCKSCFKKMELLDIEYYEKESRAKENTRIDESIRSK